MYLFSRNWIWISSVLEDIFFISGCNSWCFLSKLLYFWKMWWRSCCERPWWQRSKNHCAGMLKRLIKIKNQVIKIHTVGVVFSSLCSGVFFCVLGKDRDKYLLWFSLGKFSPIFLSSNIVNIVWVGSLRISAENCFYAFDCWSCTGKQFL